MYIPAGTFTTSHTGFKTVSGTKLRLFRFSRLPNLEVGLFVEDTTGSGLAGYQPVAYVGDEGIGYEFDYPSGSEDVFIETAVSTSFFKQAPDMSSMASEQHTDQKLLALMRAVGATVKADVTDAFPTYRGTRRYFPSQLPLVPAVEKLDDGLWALKELYDALVASLTATIIAVIEEHTQITVTGGLRDFKYTDGSPQLFTVPDKVTKIKFTLTGGGSTGGRVCGGSAASIIGYMDVVPLQVIEVSIGQGGQTANQNGQQSTLSVGEGVIATAEGGISDLPYNVFVGATAYLSTLGEELVASHAVIPGGHGHAEPLQVIQMDALGGCSMWGSAPAYGAGAGTDGQTGGVSIGLGKGGDGYALFEW